MIENISFVNGLISYKQGTDANIILRISQNDRISDLAGYSATLTIQSGYANPVTYCEIHAIIDNTTDGRFMIFKFIPESMRSASLITDVTEMVYQIKTIDGTGLISIPIRGTFRIYKELI